MAIGAYASRALALMLNLARLLLIRRFLPTPPEGRRSPLLVEPDTSLGTKIAFAVCWRLDVQNQLQAGSVFKYVVSSLKDGTVVYPLSLHCMTVIARHGCLKLNSA